MQVEHREPWTQILIPPTLPGASLKALFQNQDKLATGFDLYHTLRDFIEPSTVGAYGYNLLQSLIPPDRTCSDAKVSPEFCLCESQVLNRPPSFGVCNPFDQYGDLYCTNKDEAILPDVLEL